MKKLLALVIIFVFICSVDSFAKTVKGYYPSGSLRFVNHYNKKKQLNGWYKYYYPNGQLKEQGVYKNGKLIKINKKFYPDGSPIPQ
jgi:antitoxin component YwqK of YwqJK toxin-antitoxin module